MKVCRANDGIKLFSLPSLRNMGAEFGLETVHSIYFFPVEVFQALKIVGESFTHKQIQEEDYYLLQEKRKAVSEEEF